MGRDGHWVFSSGCPLPLYSFTTVHHWPVMVRILLLAAKGLVGQVQQQQTLADATKPQAAMKGGRIAPCNSDELCFAFISSLQRDDMAAGVWFQERDLQFSVVEMKWVQPTLKALLSRILGESVILMGGSSSGGLSEKAIWHSFLGDVQFGLRDRSLVRIVLSDFVFEVIFRGRRPS